MAQDGLSAEESQEGISVYLHFAGFRYWTASLLPALVGTTLPFWLRPRGFSFRWMGALEFLFATVLFHAGFSLLQAWFEERSMLKRPDSRFLMYGGAQIALACLLGLHLNGSLPLHRGVPGSIFIIYGLCALFVGVLYVVPPLSLCRRAGCEVVLAEGLGLIPVLGAYLVQVGDITRTVYLASLPMVVATGLWVWMDELATRMDDERSGRRTLVILFGPRFSGRCGTPALAVLLFASLLAAAFSRSVHPLSLFMLLCAGLAWKISATSWTEYSCPDRIMEARKQAFRLHLATCSIIAASSLAIHPRTCLPP